jgi:hypothetical protein
VGGRRELVVDAAGAGVVGGAPDLARAGALQDGWSVPGSYPALHLDAAGQARLAVADLADPDHPGACTYTAPVSPQQAPVRVELPYPVYPRSALLPHGRDYSLLVGLQTGVHTFAVATYDAAGKLLWEDRSGGAYPNAAAAADVDGDALDETVADDHGTLRVWASDGTLRATHPGWPPAYNLPIVGPFGAAGAPAIFRSSGINGLALLDPATQVHWFREAPIWRHYGCLGAVGDTRGDGAWKYASCAEDGVLECLEVATGAPAWSVDLKTATPPSSVIAADLDGDGGDEFLTGLADGRLVCVKEGQIAWEVQLDAAVANPIVADLDGDGLAEIVVSTSDGCVRVLR